MRKLSLIISLILLTSCVTTNPQPITTVVASTPAPQIEQQPEPLTLDDVATILSVAVKDIQTQGYDPLFLNEQHGYIWARAKDGSIKLYPLKELIQKYRDRKQANIKKEEKK